MGNAAEKLYVTIDDYVEMDEESLEKLEYYDGEIFAMAGGSPIHSLLGGNVVIAIGTSIRKSGKPCSTFNSDIKIAVSDKRFTYPDAAVICGKMETSKLISQAVTNPLIIVEVLSPSTALYDREGKFQAYQKIRYFQEYVLISQDKLLVEVYYKAKNTDFWKYRTYSSIEDIILLESIDVSIAMNDIYLNWEEEIN